MTKIWSYADEVLRFPFGANDAEVIDVQEGGAGARRQPGPTVVPIPGAPQPRPAQPRPQPRPQQATPQPPQPPPAAPAPAAPERPWSYAEEVTAPPPNLMPQARTPRPVDPNAEPDAPSWTGWAVQQVRGKQDPRYKDLPSLMDTGAVMIGDANVAQLTMPNDAAYADILKKSFQDGVTFTRQFKDANGYDIVGFKTGPDKPEQLAYVNKPGLDLEDVGRAATGTLPYLAVPGALGAIRRGAQAAGGVLGATVGALPAFSSLPIIGRIAAGATGGAAISAGQDAVATQLGSEQGLDVPKAVGAAAGTAIGTAAAPLVGNLWRRFVTEPSLYDRASGTLTEKGIKAAQEAGLDPAALPQQLQQEFAKLYARSQNARAAGVAAETGDLNIPTTLGQRTKDVAQLTREQEMRDGVWGKAASDMMKEFDQRQWNAMVNALMGEVKPGQPGMSVALNPARSPGDYAPGNIGKDITARAEMAVQAMRGKEKEAWQKIGTLEATDPALAEVPQFINQALGGLRVNRSSHPIASGMIDDLTAFMKGEAPEAAAPWLSGNPVRDVNAFRQTLSEAMRDMERGPDKLAAGRIYDGLNNWIRETAERNLLTASTADAATAAANMVTARGITRELHQVLEARGNTAGAKILKNILETADNPEQVVRSLFVGPTAKTVKPGSIAAIKSLKQMAGEIGEEGQHLVNDLKLAYWLQIVRNPAGQEGQNIFNPQVLLRNLRVSADSQASVWRELFTPAEIAMRNRLIRALENGPTFHDWTIKPNSSRSGTTIGRMFTDMLGALVGQNWAKTGVQAAGAVSGMTRAGVNKALSQELPAVAPSGFGPIGGAGGAEYGSR